MMDREPDMASLVLAKKYNRRFPQDGERFRKLEKQVKTLQAKLRAVRKENRALKKAAEPVEEYKPSYARMRSQHISMSKKRRRSRMK